MALTPVPLPAATIPLVDKDTGSMSLPWRKYFDYLSSRVTDGQTQAQVAQQAAAVAVTQANTAAAQASASGSMGAARTMTSSGSVTLNDAGWHTATAVTFASSAAASSVTITGTGPTGATASSSPYASVNGQARLIRTVGGSDAIVAGPNSYEASTDYDPSSGNSPSQTFSFTPFSSPLGADATTGPISYRVEVNRSTADQVSVQASISITRNP